MLSTWTLTYAVALWEATVLLVTTTFKLSSDRFLPINDKQTKILLHKILTGTDKFSEGWYDSLHERSTVTGSSNKLDDKDITLMVANVLTADTQSGGHEGATHFSNINDQQGLQDADITELKDGVRPVFDRIITELDKEQDMFKEPVQKFVKSFGEASLSKCKLASALQTFG